MTRPTSMTLVSKPDDVHERVAPLAVLPVFFDLHGKRAVVIGGSEAACWKVELLAAAGAAVEVFAPNDTRCPELVVLADRVTLIDRNWTETDLVGAAFAVADIEGEADIERFTAAARAAGVPYNVIDRPEHCQVQFGTIVNRSPVVVGVSTAGAAPILGQAVRRRIETLLPRTLSAWAAHAAAIRPAVMEKLPIGPRRRAFWEHLAERAFSTLSPASDPVDPTRFAAAPSTGRVTLVGAGPGDADLLTIKAVRALQSADVILFDDLVSAEVLELARREAKRMLVGKRAGRHSCRQEDINATMLTLARQGKHVVRLKSGDPMIFGRAGEEIAMLENHGIDVSVVPGVTAAIALASSLGISLTHRDHAQSVRFVTGHARDGNLPEGLDWPSLANGATTNVYYMSRRTLPRIVDRLVSCGMSPDTPAAIASDISRQGEKIWRGTLAEAVAAAADFDLASPTLFAVGAALAPEKKQAQERDRLSPLPLGERSARSAG